MGQAQASNELNESLRPGKRAHQAGDSPQGVRELQAIKDQDFRERLRS